MPWAAIVLSRNAVTREWDVASTRYWFATQELAEIDGSAEIRQLLRRDRRASAMSHYRRHVLEATTERQVSAAARRVKAILNKEIRK